MCTMNTLKTDSAHWRAMRNATGGSCMIGCRPLPSARKHSAYRLSQSWNTQGFRSQNPACPSASARTTPRSPTSEGTTAKPNLCKDVFSCREEIELEQRPETCERISNARGQAKNKKKTMRKHDLDHACQKRETPTSQCTNFR